MEQNEYIKMEHFEKFYWWHKGKLFMVNELLNKYLLKKKGKLKILEIGCGTGKTLSTLSTWGEVYGIDISKEAVNFCKSKGFKNVELADINEMDIKKYEGKFDLIVTLDVLEHIQDDVETLKRIYKMLKKGGLVLINVPAYKFLWSEHDEALHHKRRYHSLELTQKVKDSGFTIIKKSHFVFTTFFPIALFKFLSNFFKKTADPTDSYIMLPKPVNEILSKILYLEANLIKNISLPLGTTICLIAKK